MVFQQYLIFCRFLDKKIHFEDFFFLYFKGLLTKNLILPQLKSFKGRETLNVFTAFSTKLSDILMLNETHFASIRESTSVVFI